MTGRPLQPRRIVSLVAEHLAHQVFTSESITASWNGKDVSSALFLQVINDWTVARSQGWPILHQNRYYTVISTWFLPGRGPLVTKPCCLWKNLFQTFAFLQACQMLHPLNEPSPVSRHESHSLLNKHANRILRNEDMRSSYFMVPFTFPSYCLSAEAQ